MHGVMILSPSRSLERLQEVMETAGELNTRVEADKLITTEFAEKAIETIKE